MSHAVTPFADGHGGKHQCNISGLGSAASGSLSSLHPPHLSQGVAKRNLFKTEFNPLPAHVISSFDKSTDIIKWKMI